MNKTTIKVQAEVCLAPQDLASALQQFVRNELGLYPNQIFSSINKDELMALRRIQI